MTEFERRREMNAWDWPAWYLVGPAGAVQFVIMPLALPQALAESSPLGAIVDGVRCMGVDIGYHSPTPRFEGQDPMNPCPVYGDVLCFYDGSSLQADTLLKRWASGGCDEEIIWTDLEFCYAAWFKYHEGEELFVSPLTAMIEGLRRSEEDD